MHAMRESAGREHQGDASGLPERGEDPEHRAPKQDAVDDVHVPRLQYVDHAANARRQTMTPRDRLGLSVFRRCWDGRARLFQ